MSSSAVPDKKEDAIVRIIEKLADIKLSFFCPDIATAVKIFVSIHHSKDKKQVDFGDIDLEKVNCFSLEEAQL